MQKDRTGVVLQRTGDPPDRTGGAIERYRHVLPLEPAAAHIAGPLIALTPNWDDVRTYVRSYVRTYVTLENIVHSISRGRTVTKC